MRVDSSESEVRQDGMLPADEKSMLFAFVFPEVKTNAKRKTNPRTYGALLHPLLH